MEEGWVGNLSVLQRLKSCALMVKIFENNSAESEMKVRSRVRKCAVDDFFLCLWAID